MICNICKRPFTPVKGEEICLDCAKAKWREQLPEVPPKTSSPYKPLDGNSIYRVIWMRPEKPPVHIQCPPDNMQIEFRFMFISNTTPKGEIKIISNFAKDTTIKQDFFFMKIPAFCDPYTGTDRLDFKAEDIAYVSNNTIYLKDGSTVNVFFR